jgi:predicted nucleic acid-binding protein
VILVDTSVWVDHLRRGDEIMLDLLERDWVLTHPFVIGELALGHLRQRAAALRNLHRLPSAIVARDAEVMRLIQTQKLHGQGLSYADAHLLAATRLTAGAALWTTDKALQNAAERLGLAARLTH